MTEMTELFLGTYDTLRSVKRAIDDELDPGPDAPPVDDATLERLLSLSRLHAAMTRRLQDMMLDQGAAEGLLAEVQLLRESFENTQSEVALRLWSRRGQPMPGPDHPFDEGDHRADPSASGAEGGEPDEAALLRAAFEQTKRLFALQLQARQGGPAPRPDPRPRRLGRDQEQRLRADAAVRVFHRDEGFHVDLVEVSPTGARLSRMKALPTDTRVTLRYLHLSVRARVEASDEALTSLQFRNPLDPAELQALRDAAGGRLGAATASLLPGA